MECHEEEQEQGGIDKHDHDNENSDGNHDMDISLGTRFASNSSLMDTAHGNVNRPTVSKASSMGHFESQSSFATGACYQTAKRRSTTSIPLKGTSIIYGNQARRPTTVSIWTRMMTKSADGWGDEYDSDEEKGIIEDKKHKCSSIYNGVCLAWKDVGNYPRILLISVLCLAALLSISITACLLFNKEYKHDQQTKAAEIAKELRNYFRQQLNNAVMNPLFTLESFVKEYPEFKNLSMAIGQGGEPGSAPYVPAFDGVVTHRNVSGICDNEALVADFSRIAKSIKDSSCAHGVLVNLQLAPEGVNCLVYPLNNTEDFQYPLYLDNTAAIGLDNLAHPDRRAFSETTLQSSNAVITGPLTLMQCSGCPPAVKTAFIARLSVKMPLEEGYRIEVDGVSYSSWGFATAIINWETLIEGSDVYDLFGSNGMEFELTETGLVYNVTTNSYEQKTMTIAKSTNANAMGLNNFYNLSLPVTRNNWTISVAYKNGWQAPWFPLVMAASTFLSVTLATILCFVLLEKKRHKNLLREMLPSKALKKKQRNQVAVDKYDMVTIFFSDIVGYTSMCSDMRPIEVMKMLNSLYAQFDKLADTHNVYKIRTIGDSYMSVAGLDRCSDLEAAERIALFALDVIKLVERFRTHDGKQIFVRVGIHSGPAVAGFVGTVRPWYTLFGETVDIASRMESSSEEMKIQCSAATYCLLLRASNYNFRFSYKSAQVGDCRRQAHSIYIEGSKQKRRRSFLTFTVK